MNPKLTLLFLLGVATVLVVNGDGLNDVIDKASRGLEKTFVARDEVLKALKDKNLASIDRLSAAYNQNLNDIKKQTTNKEVLSTVSEKLINMFVRNFQSVESNVKSSYESLQSQLKPTFDKNFQSFKKTMGNLAAQFPSVKPYYESTVKKITEKAAKAFSNDGSELKALHDALEARFDQKVIELKV